MKKENFYTIVIIILLLLNLGTLGYLWLGNKPTTAHMPPPEQEAPLRYMAEELGLDNEQFKSLRGLARQHGKALDSVQRLITDARTSLYVLAKEDVLDTVKRNELLELIEVNESAKHLITLGHFHEIRMILNDEQKVLFNDFIEDMAMHMGMPPHNPPGRRGGPPPRRH